MQTFKEFYNFKNLGSKIDTLQSALDLAGFEPTVGTAADATNTAISVLRAALAKEKDKRKKHLLNAGISAISLIPFADVIKILKLRKAKPVAKLAVKGARTLKAYGTAQKNADRFNKQPEAESTPVATAAA